MGVGNKWLRNAHETRSASGWVVALLFLAVLHLLLAVFFGLGACSVGAKHGLDEAIACTVLRGIPSLTLIPILCIVSLGCILLAARQEIKVGTPTRIGGIVSRFSERRPLVEGVVCLLLLTAGVPLCLYRSYGYRVELQRVKQDAVLRDLRKAREAIRIDHPRYQALMEVGPQAETERQILGLALEANALQVLACEVQILGLPTLHERELVLKRIGRLKSRHRPIFRQAVEHARADGADLSTVIANYYQDFYRRGAVGAVPEVPQEVILPLLRD